MIDQFSWQSTHTWLIAGASQSPIGNSYKSDTRTNEAELGKEV